MFQLKYNGGFLDLAKDQSLEFERENPLFILDDFYKEYSSPITIKYTENNVALLGAMNKPVLALACMLCGAIVTAVVAVLMKKYVTRKTAQINLAH